MAPPTACNRSAGPAVEPVPVRPRHVVDAFGSVSYPRIPLRRPAILSFGGVPLVCLRACGDRRAHSENGSVPEGCPARRDGGLCLFRALPAHHAEGPQQPHELGGGGGVRLRLGHAPFEHLLASPEQALGPLPPVQPRNLLATASPVSASSAQTVVDLRCTSIPKAVEYLGTGASQPRCGAAAPLALQQHCRSPDPRSRAGAPVVSAPLDWVIVSVRPLPAALSCSGCGS